MTGVDEPIEFGDTLGFDIVKKKDGKSVTKHVECTFCPELVPLLLEAEIIEEKDAEDEKPETIDFSGDENPEEERLVTQDKFDEFIDKLAQDFTTLQIKVKDLTKRVGELECKYIISESNKVPPFSNKYTYNPDAFKVYCAII